MDLPDDVVNFRTPALSESQEPSPRVSFKLEVAQIRHYYRINDYWFRFSA